jgi:hypothetical protein
MPRRPEPSDYFSPPKPAMTESELRAQVVRLAHALGWKVFSLPIARTRRPVKDATGYPDLTLAREGRVLWIELKTQHGALSPAQLSWQAALPEFYVVRPFDLGTLGNVLS